MSDELVNWFSSPLRFQEAQRGLDRLMTLHCGEHFRLITALAGRACSCTARMTIIYICAYLHLL